MNDEEASPVPRALVIVPWRPGPLLELPAEPSRQRDDLDEVLDALFGEPTREGPGLFDIGLIAGGTALAAAAGFAHLAAGLAVFGAVLAALGLVLPVRDLWQRAARHRARRRLDASLGQGLLLDAGDPLTGGLAGAYRHLTSLCTGAGGLGEDALEAAHLAMVEVAGVLQGRPPRGAAEQEYVTTRAHALETLARVLPDRPVAASDPAADAEAAARDAGISAVRALEERTGTSSLARIDMLRGMLAGDDP